MEIYELSDDLKPRDGAVGSPGSARAIILAGGRGARLAPFTSVLPKPLMPVGERAILELVVDRLEACGITDITFCVGYLAHLIQAVFDQRSNRDVQITFVRENSPLGTAGPLLLVDSLDEPFIVMNGDLLTTLDYRDLLRHHCESENMLTIASHERTIKIDYGVLRLNDPGGDHRILAYDEKPEVVSTVSMGIYVLDPEALHYIPPDQPFDFPDLVQALLSAKLPVGAYVFDGMWFDIGRREDYEEAVQAWLEQSPETVPTTAAPSLLGWPPVRAESDDAPEEPPSPAQGRLDS